MPRKPVEGSEGGAWGWVRLTKPRVCSSVVNMSVVLHVKTGQAGLLKRYLGDPVTCHADDRESQESHTLLLVTDPCASPGSTSRVNTCVQLLFKLALHLLMVYAVVLCCANMLYSDCCELDKALPHSLPVVATVSNVQDTCR